MAKNYHEKLTEVRVRFPAEDEERGIPDYLSLMRDRAKNQGFIDKKSKEGSVNSYILDLVETDLRNVIPDFEMIKSLKDKKKNDERDVKDGKGRND